MPDMLRVLYTSWDQVETSDVLKQRNPECPASIHSISIYWHSNLLTFRLAERASTYTHKYIFEDAGTLGHLCYGCVSFCFLGTLAVFALRFLCSLPLEADAAITWVNNSLAHSLPSQERGPLYLSPLAVYCWFG